MKRLDTLWESLRASLWFVPTLIVTASVALALGLVELDSMASRANLMEAWPRLFGAGAEGSRGLLSTIAGSMVTVTGVTFSITIVALALASSQYTSRVLANFIRDRANQTVLGFFLGVFAYCLVVLRTVRGGDEGTFVPGVAVLVALLLSFVAIGFLIFFIHHIAGSIQATRIIATTAQQTLHAVDRLFPTQVGEPLSDSSEPHSKAPSEAEWSTVASPRSGYLQAVDVELLLKLAREHDTVIKMERGLGEFAIEGCPLASVSGPPPDRALQRKLASAYTISRQRTLPQDAAYGLRQIVDVALKALSPGVNDTTTAVSCIDFLGAILARLIERRVEPQQRAEAGQLRVIARGATFAELVGLAFDQIRQNAAGNVAILVRLLEVLGLLLERTKLPERRFALQQQAEKVVELGERSVPAAGDRAVIVARMRPSMHTASA